MSDPTTATLMGLAAAASEAALDVVEDLEALDALEALTEDLRRGVAFAVHGSPQVAHRVLLSWFVLTAAVDAPSGQALRALLPKGSHDVQPARPRP